MCHTEYSQYECGHSTVIEIACQQATLRNKAACTDLPTDNMDDVTRLKSLCKLCLRDERLRQPDEPFVGVEEPPKGLPDDPNCGNPKKIAEVPKKSAEAQRKDPDAPKEAVAGPGWWQISKDMLRQLLLS